MLLSKCFKSQSIGHATVECSYDEGKGNDLEEEETFIMSMLTKPTKLRI